MSTFTDNGIIVPQGAKGQTKMICPKCSETRRKKGDTCLSVNIDDGLWKCHHCSWGGNLGMKTAPPEAEWPTVNGEGTELSDATIDWFEKRQILGGQLDHFKLTEIGGQVCFNYYAGAKLINIKRRGIATKTFSQVKGATRIPYNLNSLHGYETCVVTEGEIDTLSIHVAGIKPCVSLSDGAVQPNDKALGKLKCIDNTMKFFRKMKSIVLAMDNDEPGRRTTIELAKKLGWERCRVVEYPAGCKDANDVLVKYGHEALFQCIETAKPHPEIEGAKRSEASSRKLRDWLMDTYDIRRNVIDSNIWWRPDGTDDPMKRFEWDYNVPNIAVDGEEALGFNIPASWIELQVKDLASRNTFDPFSEYLESLSWDGVDRLDDLYKSITTDNDDLFRVWFTKWFVAAVPTAMGKYANDMVLTLQGDQYSGKSFFQANLLPSDAPWRLTEVAPKFDTQNDYHLVKLCENMMVVLDEMAAYSKNEVADLKSVISQKEFTANLKWRRDNVTYSRRATLAGNVNPQFFLKDVTGDRRYLVFQCLKRDRKMFDMIDKAQLLSVQRRQTTS